MPGLAGLWDSKDVDDDDLPLSVNHVPLLSRWRPIGTLSGKIPLSRLDVYPGGRRRDEDAVVSTLDAGR